MNARQPSHAPDPGQAHLEGLSTAFTHRHGADPAVVRRTLVSLRRTVHDEDDLTDLLDRAAAAAVAWLPDAHSAGITVSLGAATFTAASTDSRVVALDEAQYALHHGPCMHAMTVRATVAMSLAEVTSSWPDLAGRAAAEGVRSFLAAPLLVGPKVLGSLNLYSTRAQGFPADEVAFVTVVAALAAAHLRTFGEHRDLPEQARLLRAGVAHRAVIRRARGMIMAVDDVGADQAFATLRARSVRAGIPVVAAAELMVATASVGLPDVA
ncbi:MAG: GAF and ANTAR domain-containing protein [Mycobacteriaceae bacterium]